MVWTNNLSPFIFKIGAFGLRWYGMAYVLGFVLAYLSLRKAMNRGQLVGLTQQGLEQLIYWIIAGVLVGGRLGFCVQKPGEWLHDPFFLFKVWQGGMAFFGGLLGVVLAVVLFSRKSKMSGWEFGDILAAPAALALGIGRIANFVNGELWGTPTHAKWGVIYPHMDYQPRHPSELYEMVTHFVLAGLLVLVGRSRLASIRGAQSACFVIGYGFFRIFTEAFRETDTMVGPLTNGQAASIVTFLVGLGMLGFLMKKSGKNTRVATVTEPES